MQEVFLPDSVTKIGLKAFSDCTSLRIIRIPPSLEDISPEAFLNCDALSALEFARFPEPGSRIYKRWKKIISKTLLAFNMYRDKKLTPELAEFYLEAAQEADNKELVKLMEQYLRDCEESSGQ